MNIPDGAYAVRFFDIATAEVEGIPTKSDRLNVSPKHFLGGRVMTLEEVEREMPDERILIGNMTVNRWNAVIHTRSNHYLPFDQDDVLVQL